ncbi:MAG: hypothetical protein M0P12_12300 [Paludibacteraceae bacterium]|nr:hypothetical protein [Paludibacteraceae bacterium]
MNNQENNDYLKWFLQCNKKEAEEYLKKGNLIARLEPEDNSGIGWAVIFKKDLTEEEIKRMRPIIASICNIQGNYKFSILDKMPF